MFYGTMLSTKDHHGRASLSPLGYAVVFALMFGVAWIING